MKPQLELLYEVFEQNLFSELEVASLEPFAEKVTSDYIKRVKSLGFIIPEGALESLEVDIKEEVLDMTRKKTYGFINIEEYRVFFRKSKKLNF